MQGKLWIYEIILLYWEQTQGIKKHEINSVTEQLVLKYYQECGNNYDSCNPPQFSELVTVTGIIFPMVYTEKQHVFGFLMECSWDLENGLAVKFVDDKSEVGYQDILM